jgi:hypothetical protein
MMVRDSITEEIREIRHRLAEKFDNDVDRIGEDLRRRQNASGRRVVQLPKRPPRISVPTNDPMPPSDEAARLEMENLSSSPGDR